RIFLPENDLPLHRQIASAIFLRPGKAGPAASGEMIFPGAAKFEAQPFAIADPVIAELREIGFQPVAHLGPEGVVLCGKGQIHRAARLAYLFFSAPRRIAPLNPPATMSFISCV